MKANKSQSVKKTKKALVLQTKSIRQKQKASLLASAPTQSNAKQLENYKAFFRFLLSNDLDNELAD